MFRKPKSTSTKNTRPNVNSIDKTTTDNSVKAILNYNPKCESDYDKSDENMVASIASNTLQFEPKNTTLQIGNTKLGFLMNSGSVCSILSESIAT